MGHRLFAGRSAKCAVPHGHNETVIANLRAVSALRLDGDVNMVELFEHAKGMWHRWIDDAVDHALQLSDRDPLIDYFAEHEPHLMPRLMVCPGDPTTELLAACFMAKLNAFLSAAGGRLHCLEIAVEETPTNKVTFSGVPADVLPVRHDVRRTVPWWDRADMDINDLNRACPNDVDRRRTGRKSVPRDSAQLEFSSRDYAEEAVKALLVHIGEDADRPGLADTPRGVVEAFEELFAGYRIDPLVYLQRTFEEIEGYDGMVLLKHIPFHSHSERDFGVFTGEMHIAYLPHQRVVGLSKLPRVVEALSQRLQTQERLTVEIASTLEKGLAAEGVAVLVEAEHHGIVARGVEKAGTRLQTSCLLGKFRTDIGLRSEFLSLVRSN